MSLLTLSRKVDNLLMYYQKLLPWTLEMNESLSKLGDRVAEIAGRVDSLDKDSRKS
jgi:hypothetical protein